jgi:hypothetical protein
MPIPTATIFVASSVIRIEIHLQRIPQLSTILLLLYTIFHSNESHSSLVFFQVLRYSLNECKVVILMPIFTPLLIHLLLIIKLDVIATEKGIALYG